MTLAKYEPQIDLTLGGRPVFPWGNIPHPGAPVLIGVGCALFAPTVFGAATPLALILLGIGSLNDVIFVSRRMAKESEPKTIKADYEVIQNPVTPVPEQAATLTELKPKSKRYEDDPRYTQPNPFAVKQAAVATISDSDDELLPTHKELDEMDRCNKACVPYQEFCVMADAMVRMGAPRPTPASLAATLHYTQHPMDKGVGGVVEQLESPVGEPVEMTLEPSVVEPLAKPDPKEQVISVVDKFLSAGNKLDIERVDIEGSNELKVIRKAAQVGLSLHWLSLKFKINKNTKAYNSLEVCFTQNGGKVNR